MRYGCEVQAEAVGEPPQAKMLDVILYSREQLIQERDAMASKQVRAERRRQEPTRRRVGVTASR